jgi:acyl carrier protein
MDIVEKKESEKETLDGIFVQVVGIISEKFGKSSDKISLESNISNDLALDSLDIVELIMEFEKTFDTTIPDEVAEKIKTVKDIVDYIYKNKK